MAQQAIENRKTTDDAVVCAACDEEIEGVPFYPFKDLSRYANGEFVPKADANAYCNVQCLRNYNAIKPPEETDA